MNTILKQRNFFVTKEFEIMEDSLKVRTSQPFSYADAEIKFENITSVITKFREPNRVLSLFTILIFICAVCAVISHFFAANGSEIEDIALYIILFAVFVFLLGLTYKNNVNLVLFTGHSITFYARSPSSNAVNEYIHQILAQQKIYLLKRYAENDLFLSEDQLSTNLKWLWERKIINDSELEDLRHKLLSKNSAQKVVGFRFNSSDN
jgi:hypothetical protein